MATLTALVSWLDELALELQALAARARAATVSRSASVLAGYSVAAAVAARRDGLSCEGVETARRIETRLDELASDEAFFAAWPPPTLWPEEEQPE